jgi:hypothetical protein
MAAIELEQQTVEALKERAAARGLTLEAFLRQVATGLEAPAAASAAAPSARDAVRDFDAALDELFAADTRRLPPLTLTYTREDIYADHD